MRTTNDQTVAAGHSVEVDPAGWQVGWRSCSGRVAGRFGRVEPRRRARGFVLGLLADLPRKSCWTIAEHAGQASPDGLRHLLAGAVWDHDGVRDDVRGYLVDHLGDPAAVLVVDETGDLKKGASTVGVGRQYTGTAGKVDNAQVAVYLTDATTAGSPRWSTASCTCPRVAGRRQALHAAGVPTPRAFATKPELARVMLERALAAGVPAGWVTADEVYGNSPGLRGWLEGRRLPTCWRSSAPSRCRARPVRPCRRPGWPSASHRTAGCASASAGVPRVAAGMGGAACRWPAPARPRGGGAGCWFAQPSHRELAYYLCAGPAGLPLVALVRVAGCRWRVEEALAGRQGAVRPGPAPGPPLALLYRWVTLAMLA